MRIAIRSAALAAAAQLVLASTLRPQSPLSCPIDWALREATIVTRVECRTIQVPQDWSGFREDLAPVSLQIVRLESSRDATPVLFLAGGPGESAIDVVQHALLASPVGQAIVRTRPLIVFDRRGASSINGRANPDLGSLGYALSADGEEPHASLRDSANRAAAALRRRNVHPRFFTTLASIEDIRAVVREFGYRRVILYATSYGTKEALQFMRRHPEMVEAAILDGVVAPQHQVSLSLALGDATAGEASAGHAGRSGGRTLTAHTIVRDAVLCGDGKAGMPQSGGRAICDALRVGFDGPDAIAPVSSAIPTLLLAGALDALTPPTMAAEAARTLSRSHTVVFPAAGHLLTLNATVSTCVAEIVEGFMAAPTRTPATTCVPRQ